MQIKVINLLRAADRRGRMQEQAERLGLPLDFVVATDGRDLTDADRALVDIRRRKRASRYPLSDGEIGCWLSHTRIMRAFLDSDQKMICILEDDARLSPDFARVVAAIESSGLEFDFIDLHRIFKKGEIFAPCRPLAPGFMLGRVGLMHMHATSYVLSRRGAQKFLAYAPRFVHVIDKEMHRYWANGLDIYGLDVPVVVADDGGFSYIDETRKQDKPRERVPYPDADSLYWRMQRKGERLVDSMIKRIAFPFYVWRGRQAVKRQSNSR